MAQVKPIPEGYQSVIPYLTIDDAEAQLQFLKQAFGATERHIMRADGKLMHGEVQIGDSVVMLANASDRFPARPASFYLYVPDTDATYNKAIAAGASSVMEPADQFYGDRNAGVVDKAGNSWWIATHVEDVSPEEMKRREQEWMEKRAAETAAA